VQYQARWIDKGGATIMQVAGSASREHKHDSHNTESFNNNFRGCCVRCKPAGGLKTRDVFLGG